MPKQKFIKIAAGENTPKIMGMSYSSTHDELFTSDMQNKVVRALKLQDNSGSLHDVYKGSVTSVCYMSQSDTLLLCSYERGPESKAGSWLVALKRSPAQWREEHRMKTEDPGVSALISCELSDSRVLIGEFDSSYMELFRIESGPRIARINPVQVDVKYRRMSATCGLDTLVAISCYGPEVRLYLLCIDKLEELARTQIIEPQMILFVADRLLATEQYDKSIAELDMNTGLEKHFQHVAFSEGISVFRWCAVNKGLVVFDTNSRDILHYEFE